jgi:hypothetical protein
LAARRAAAQQLSRLERRISNARLIVFATGVAVALVAFDTHRLSPWWIAVPAALFIGLVVHHDTVIRNRQRADRAVSFYERGMARLDDRWMGGGEAGERFLDPAHPYANDLDLFGRGSLFELLCTARTRAGEDTLANWLRAPAPAGEVLGRQAAVDELRFRLDLREDLALIGASVRAGLHPEALEAWCAAAPTLAGNWRRVVAALLAASVVIIAVLWATTGIGLWALLAALCAEGILGVLWSRRVAHVIRHAQQPAYDLMLLAQLLARVEQERFTAPRLVALRAALDIDGLPPSRQIARLNRLIHLLDARRNEFFGAIAALLLWGTQLALAIEAWRAACGPVVSRWLSVVGECEALCALAGYAYEHARDPFPEITDGGPCFDADGLGHPLLPESRCVRNDVRLGEVRVLIVSGSNMSGKSTLLRSVGTNAVLALAGAPVRADRLRLSPLAVGASMRILDSLQAGTSHFYAEITRLRQLMELTTGPLPVLFLLDEILHGTNSHDRGVGAEALMRSFVARGAIGLVTTHDLALARVADALASRAANVHFEDRLEDGQMYFDYRMYPGVVRKSNAVALMRAVGLDV